MQARALAAVVVAVLAVAAPGVAAERATHVYRVPGSTVSLRLPTTWKAVDAKHVLNSAELQKLEQENPELGTILAAANTPNSPVKFFAFDPLVKLGFATNANVVITSIPTTVTFDTYAAALASEIRSLRSISQLRTTRVTLPAGPAVRLTYRLRVTANGKTFQTSTLQYAFLHGGDESVVVTYTTLPVLQKRYASTFRASANSISLG